MHLGAVGKRLVLSAASSYVAFLAIGMANQPIETFPLALHFWFLMGLMTSYMARKILDYQRRQDVDLRVEGLSAIEKDGSLV